MWTWMGPSNQVLGGRPDSPGGRGSFCWVRPLRCCLLRQNSLATYLPSGFSLPSLLSSSILACVLPIRISLPDHPVLLATFPLWPFLCLHLLLGTLYLHTFDTLSTPYPPLNATKNSTSSRLPLPSSHPVPAPRVRSRDFWRYINLYVGRLCV